jgi:hypothetical protein
MDMRLNESYSGVTKNIHLQSPEITSPPFQSGLSSSMDETHNTRTPFKCVVTMRFLCSYSLATKAWNSAVADAVIGETGFWRNIFMQNLLGRKYLS